MFFIKLSCTNLIYISFYIEITYALYITHFIKYITRLKFKFNICKKRLMRTDNYKFNYNICKKTTRNSCNKYILQTVHHFSSDV